MSDLRPELPPLPASMSHLPIDARGYPVPWFVAWADGKPDHRVADSRKRTQAICESLCWVCGKPLAAWSPTFLIGPMCLVNRVSAEPPSHPVCAEFSVRACPFLTRPHANRRDAGMPDGASWENVAGQPIVRNPGVTVAYFAINHHLVSDGRGGVLFDIGDPVLPPRFWREGREATLDEVIESIRTGLPHLESLCTDEPGNRLVDLHREVTRAVRLVMAAKGGAA